MSPSPSTARTILVVDDDRFIRELLAAVLEDSGFEFFQASSGTEALTLCAEFVPDIVLLDVMMPGLDGLEVCRTMRSDPRFAKTKIFILTADASPAKRAIAFEHGADAFFAKPFSALDLIDCVTADGCNVA